MVDNNQSVVVVQSKGFSDKRIKIDALKNAKDLTINGDDIQSYLDSCAADDLTEEMLKESRQEIGICYKPRLRYRAHKEENSDGKLMSRSEINKQYVGANMENLFKMDASIVRYVITALLTGKALGYKQIQKMVYDETGKKIATQNINSDMWKLSKSKIGFIFKRVGRKPAIWKMDERATKMEEPDIYEMFKKVGNFTLEQAMRKYPFLADILKEKGGPAIDPPDEKTQVTSEEKILRPYVPKNDVITTDLNPIEKLADALTKNDGKIDFNVNINFKITFGGLS